MFINIIVVVIVVFVIIMDVILFRLLFNHPVFLQPLQVRLVPPKLSVVKYLVCAENLGIEISVALWASMVQNASNRSCTEAFWLSYWADSVKNLLYEHDILLCV